VELYPEEEEEEIIELFEPYGLDRESMEPMMVRFRQNSEKFVDFMMRFELNLELPDPNRSGVIFFFFLQRNKYFFFNLI
jgi:hypothetical protein